MKDAKITILAYYASTITNDRKRLFIVIKQLV